MAPKEKKSTQVKPDPQVLKIAAAILVVVMLVAVAFMVNLGSDCDEEDDDIRYRSTEEHTPKEKRGELTFNVTIDTAGNASELRLWLPYPMSNENQLIEDVRIDGNFDYSGVFRENGSGSIALYAEWKDPDETPRLSYSFNVTRREIIKKNFPDGDDPVPVEVQKYLEPSSRGPVTGNVREMAVDVTGCAGGGNILAKAIAIYDFIVENGQRDPTITGCGDGDVCALLDLNLSGKCADIHSVFVAMARSVGVPAREIFGTRIAKEGDITGAYHCRAEFYLPGYGWVPVDPSDVRKTILVENLTLSDQRAQEAREYYFGTQTETYIDFYSGRDIILNPRQAGEPLNYFMYPYAEADGVPLDHLSQEELQYTVSFVAA